MSNIYELEKYPFFRVEFSTKKNLNVIKIYYYKIYLENDGEKLESNLFLDDRKKYLFIFQDMTIIFYKEKNGFNIFI